MVLPSFAEGLPVVLMEALALGRPVVTTFVAGIPELVEAGWSGWLVPAGSVDELTDALRQALETPVDRLEAMGRIGAERAAARHDARTEAAKLAALFYAMKEWEMTGMLTILVWSVAVLTLPVLRGDRNPRCRGPGGLAARTPRRGRNDWPACLCRADSCSQRRIWHRCDSRVHPSTTHYR